MQTWSFRTSNKALATLRTKQRYQHQLSEFLRDDRDRLKTIEEILERKVTQRELMAV